MNKRQRKKLENKFGAINIGKYKNAGYKFRKSQETLKAGQVFLIKEMNFNYIG